jgi:hypothetical protein
MATAIAQLKQVILAVCMSAVTGSGPGDVDRDKLRLCAKENIKVMHFILIEVEKEFEQGNF